MSSGPATGAPARPRILLGGDAAARPAGLERALTRAGFLVSESAGPAGETPPDAILLTLPHAGEGVLREALDRGPPGLPRLVLVAGVDPGAPAAALSAGADDAIAAPVHLPELCARLLLRIRDRLPSRAVACDPPPRAALERRVEEEFERARRYALSFSLILLDLAPLSEITARHGAEVGSRLGRAAATRIRRELRAPDFVCRYGGDEFAVVLPETGAEGARRSVARIRESLLTLPLDPGLAEEPPRLSAGIATYPHPGAARADDLIALVETGLARARAQTGERVAVVE